MEEVVWITMLNMSDPCQNTVEDMVDIYRDQVKIYKEDEMPEHAQYILDNRKRIFRGVVKLRKYVKTL